jgi:hypothetical protein
VPSLEDSEEMFDSTKFTELLRGAQTCLDDACDMLEAAEPAAIAPPGLGYLLARLHLALEVVELELPEFKAAGKLTAAAAVAETFDNQSLQDAVQEARNVRERLKCDTGWRGETFGQGAPKL